MSQPHSSNDAEYTHLGAYFKSLREHYELEVNQVASRLHIRPKYIEAIEEGDMASLPGKVYTQGYIHSYADFLGLDAPSVIAQYEGLDATAKVSDFHILEPSEPSGLPAWRYLALAAFAMALVYTLVDWASTPSTPNTIEQRIEPVPERLKIKAEQALILTPRNEACLSLKARDDLLPCYYSEQEPPMRSIMELAR